MNQHKRVKVYAIMETVDERIKMFSSMATQVKSYYLLDDEPPISTLGMRSIFRCSELHESPKDAMDAHERELKSRLEAAQSAERKAQTELNEFHVFRSRYTEVISAG